MKDKQGIQYFRELLVLGLAISAFSSVILAKNSALAEIKADTTLGNEPSIINQGIEVKGAIGDRIDGGAVRGANLFHSFQEFSLEDGQRVYFSNPAAIQNIFTRVTGHNRSEILGTLGVLGNANLFLINPNGILFGANASLDIAGSFVTSTADSLVFDNGLIFSAKNPQTVPLLAVNVPLGLQFGTQPAAIQVQAANLVGGDDKTLALVGGDIRLAGGILQVATGRIELGSVAGIGIVGVNVVGDRLNLNFPDTIPMADISLSQAALVDVSGERAGDIQVQGKQVSLTEGSRLVTNTLGTLSGGSLQINATESLDLSGTNVNGNQGGLFARTFGTGNAASITINTSKLTAQQGARISAATFDQGLGGNLLINASQSVELIGTTGGGNRPSAFFADSEGNGNAGNLTINTGRLTLRDGSLISVATRDGKGGNLIINASQSVELLGNTPDGTLSSELAAYTLGDQDAGNIEINTDKLIVRDGALILLSTLGKGKGGNLSINASDSVEISGTGKVGEIVFGSSLLSQSNEIATGNAGNIEINSSKLTVRDGGLISTSTSSPGNAGNISINTTQFVDVLGTSPNDEVASQILTQVNDRATGNGGELQITTRQLNVRDGGLISASTFAQGNAGNLTVNASESVEVSGFSPDGFSSGIFTNSSGTGNARELNINTKRLIVSNGGVISASTRGAGNAGNLTVNASESIEVSGAEVGENRTSRIAVRSLGDGSAGNLQIFTPELRLQSNGEINVNASGSGDPGNLNITATNIFLNQGKINAETNFGSNANITLQVAELIFMRNRSLISSQAFNKGSGGNININTNFIVTVPNEDSDIIANAFEGSGGKINITAQSIFGLIARPTLTPLSDINASSELGINGSVEINTPDLDPDNGLVALPENVVDASKLIAQTCRGAGEATASQQSEFVVTGRGGLPSKPIDSLSSDAIWQDLQSYTLLNEKLSSTGQETSSVSPQPTDIIEAQGWVTNADGKITLLAQAPTTTPDHSSFVPVSCPVAQN